MAVHIGSPKQGQWGQQGQTPNFSHTHARYNVGGKIIFPPAFPQDYVRPELLKKTHDRRITESTVLLWANVSPNKRYR